MPDTQGRCPAPSAADCEHFFQTHIRGGEPLSVRICTFCRLPDWADLREQLDVLYGGNEAALTRVLGGGRTAHVIAQNLNAHGHAIQRVRYMTDEQLLAVPGIGETSLSWIRNAFPAPEGEAGATSSDSGVQEFDHHFVAIGQHGKAIIGKTSGPSPIPGEDTIHSVRATLQARRATKFAFLPGAMGDDCWFDVPTEYVGPLPELRLLDCGYCYEEQGEEVHPHPECPVGSTAPGEFQQVAVWRRKAVRRALRISKLTGAIQAVNDLAHEDGAQYGGWGVGYQAALSDLREVLQEFDCLMEATDG